MTPKEYVAWVAEDSNLFPGVIKWSGKFWKLFWQMMHYKRCEDARCNYWAYSNGIHIYGAYLDFGGPFP